MTQVTHTYGLTRGGTEQPPWEGAGEDAQELLLLELLPLELLLKPRGGDNPAEETPSLSPCSAALGGREEAFGEQIWWRGRAASWEPAAASPTLRSAQRPPLPSARPAHLCDGRRGEDHCRDVCKSLGKDAVVHVWQDRAYMKEMSSCEYIFAVFLQQMPACSARMPSFGSSDWAPAGLRVAWASLQKRCGSV